MKNTPKSIAQPMAITRICARATSCGRQQFWKLVTRKSPLVPWQNTAKNGKNYSVEGTNLTSILYVNVVKPIRPVGHSLLMVCRMSMYLLFMYYEKRQS